jgi:hypothetical protein
MKRNKQTIKVIEGDKIVSKKAIIRCLQTAYGELYLSAEVGPVTYLVLGDNNGEKIWKKWELV